MYNKKLWLKASKVTEELFYTTINLIGLAAAPFWAIHDYNTDGPIGLIFPIVCIFLPSACVLPICIKHLIKAWRIEL